MVKGHWSKNSGPEGRGDAERMFLVAGFWP